MQEW